MATVARRQFAEALADAQRAWPASRQCRPATRAQLIRIANVLKRRAKRSPARSRWKTASRLAQSRAKWRRARSPALVCRRGGPASTAARCPTRSNGKRHMVLRDARRRGRQRSRPGIFPWCWRCGRLPRPWRRAVPLCSNRPARRRFAPWFRGNRAEVRAAGGVFQSCWASPADIARGNPGETPLPQDLVHRLDRSRPVADSGRGRRSQQLSLELGGRAPFLVFADADLEKAVQAVMIAKFRNTGQSCIAANRPMFSAACYSRFLERLVPRSRA